METTARNTGLLIGALAISMVILLASGIYYWSKSNNLTALNDKNELRADSLLSAKLQLESEIQKLNQQIAATNQDNTDLNKRIVEANQRLNQSDATLLELRRGNANRMRTITSLNQNVKRLSVMRDSLTNQMVAMHEKIDWQKDSTKHLRSENTELQKQVNELDTRLLAMVPRSTVTGDNFRVEAVKANRKVTAKAKKANGFTISFTVPAAMQLDGAQEVYLSLSNEMNKAALPALRTATVALDNVNEVVPIHAEQTVSFNHEAQRLTFWLDPTADLKPGVYRASFYTKEAYLGSVEFKLRDSFWFF